MSSVLALFQRETTAFGRVNWLPVESLSLISPNSLESSEGSSSSSYSDGGGRFKEGVAGADTAVLHIRAVEAGDLGVYKCSADNGVGKGECEVRLEGMFNHAGKGEGVGGRGIEKLQHLHRRSNRGYTKYLGKEDCSDLCHWVGIFWFE